MFSEWLRPEQKVEDTKQSHPPRDLRSQEVNALLYKRKRVHSLLRFARSLQKEEHLHLRQQYQRSSSPNSYFPIYNEQTVRLFLLRAISILNEQIQRRYSPYRHVQRTEHRQHFHDGSILLRSRQGLV